MPFIYKKAEPNLPFHWLNEEDLSDNQCLKYEIYIPEPKDIQQELIDLFYTLFDIDKDQLVIGNRGKWGDFCLDTWNQETGEYDYSLSNKSFETIRYLSMLSDSNVEAEYSGYSICQNWDSFLSLTLSCVLSHIAPYSHLFYNPSKEYVFYFHHTGSIGIFFPNNNIHSNRFRGKAEKNGYDVVVKEENY